MTAALWCEIEASTAGCEGRSLDGNLVSAHERGDFRCRRRPCGRLDLGADHHSENAKLYLGISVRIGYPIEPSQSARRRRRGWARQNRSLIVVWETHDTPTSHSDQRKAQAGRDVVGRDKITHVHHAEQRSQIDGWLDKLADELKDNVAVLTFVDNLQYYFQPNPYDDVIGLEAKLDHSGRSAQKSTALRKKEAFSKLLEEWAAYPAAQEIIAYFLAKIDSSFDSEIVDMLGINTNSEVDKAIRIHLIDPVLQEMGCGPFMLNHVNVGGMVYWLAEQCYVRWHT